jgi:hypothetical protein
MIEVLGGLTLCGCSCTIREADEAEKMLDGAGDGQ